MFITALMNILPHRYPFLMVDRIVEFDGGLKATGVKAVTINEPYFQGHFPGHPVMPGVLQLEAMAQVSSIVMMRRTENDGKIGYFMSADEVKFRKPVMPGDTLFIECELTSAKKRLGKASCRCLVNGEWFPREPCSSASSTNDAHSPEFSRRSHGGASRWG